MSESNSTSPSLSNHVDNSEEEEYIPPAPAFCERLSPEEAEKQSKELTKKGLDNLYKHVHAVLEAKTNSKTINYDMKEYNKTQEQMKLMGMIDEFFDHDEQRQKGKLFDYLITEKKNKDRIELDKRHYKRIMKKLLMNLNIIRIFVIIMKKN